MIGSAPGGAPTRARKTEMSERMNQTEAKSASPGDERLRDELLKLLSHQRTLYRRLRSLAERQKALVMSDDVSPLLSLLTERQRLVDGLTRLNARLAPFRKRWPEIYGLLDEATRRRVSEMLEEANASLGAILAGDGRDCTALSARREHAANRLTRLDARRRASDAYAADRAGATSRGREITA